MCEIQEYSIEHKDIYFNKYSECSGMDLYITDSLQDMLDMDIKNEIATDLSSVTDFSDSLGMNFNEMSPLIDVDNDHSETWLNNYTSSFLHNIDLYGSEANAVMVNPNSVMPNTFAETPVKSIVKEEASDLLLSSAATDTDSPASNSFSPKEEKSHLTFSPKEIKVAKVKQEPEEPATKKHHLEEGTQMVIYVRKQDKNVVKDLLKDLDSGKTKINTNASPLPTVRIKTTQPEVIKLNGKNCSIINANQKTTSLGTKTIISGNIHILDTQQSRAILANGNKNQTTFLIDNSTLSSRQLLKTSMSGAITVDSSHAKYVNTSNKNSVGEFPKPAYSYSCLIAMALKNSRTGSLPVSEIYNFMCHHFPYFKTAPNGWKNSVRHNLSLNKCFEKIEKPSTNGSQRKGCLWAMNPAKIGKMDEEVQKWSRKDPQAIKKAMVYPENLEALERGEMKYSSGGADADTEAEDEADNETDADLDVDDNREDTEDDAAEQEQESDGRMSISGTGVSGGVRLLPAISQLVDADTDHEYDDVDVDDSHLDTLHLHLSDDYAVPSAKRHKPSFLVYQPVSTPTHTSRRKTPLVNRVALI